MAPQKGMDRDDRQVPQVSIQKISIFQHLLALRYPPEPRRWRAVALALRGQGADSAFGRSVEHLIRSRPAPGSGMQGPCCQGQIMGAPQGDGAVRTEGPCHGPVAGSCVVVVSNEGSATSQPSSGPGSPHLLAGQPQTSNRHPSGFPFQLFSGVIIPMHVRRAW